MGRKESTLPEWDQYIRAAVSQEGCVRSQCLCAGAFDAQRDFIRKLIRDKRPRRIACLGSGYLNDIPIEDLCNEDQRTYLVDWIPDISIEGLRGRIISEDEAEGEDCFSCLFCTANAPAEHCVAYQPTRDGQTVCDAFCSVREPTLCCGAYAPGPAPEFVTHDLTGGVASRFAARAGKVVDQSTSPEDAFRRATSACGAAARATDHLPIEENSLDLVTCSMVVSQFDSEPYTYFSNLLQEKFGRERITLNEERLLPLMEKLRTELFRVQMESHTEEIYRLVEKEAGAVYFSVELFRSVPESTEYFLVRDIPMAMEILGKRFFFDFSEISPEEALRPAPMGDAVSIVQNYVLRPRGGRDNQAEGSH